MRAGMESLPAGVELVMHHTGYILVNLSLATLLMVQGCSSDGTGASRGLANEGARRAMPGTPRMLVDKTTYDLGDIRPNSTRMAVFHLANVGGGVLRIEDVRKCCGAVVKLEKEALGPNETAVLTAEFSVAQSSSAFNKKIGLLTTDPENPQTELTVMGKVVQTLAWTPARFETAGYKKDIACPEITIRSLDGVPFSIKGFTATGQCLTAELDPNHKAAEFALKPTVDMAKLNGLAAANGNIRIDLDHPDYKVINVAFSVIPALQATPPQLLVFNAKAGEPVVRPLQVQDNQADPNSGVDLQVESVTCKNGGRAELHGVTAGKTGCELRLEIWPGDAKESESFSADELTIRMKDGRQIIVPLRVFYQVPALSAASPGT